MKQHKFGEKVQNWHRPLQPGQLKHRYAKEKHDDPFAIAEINAAQTSLTEFNRLQSLDRNAEIRDGELAIDDHWNFIYGNDDLLAELSYSDLIDESDCSEYQMRQFIIEMCLPRSPLIPQSVATVPSAQVEAQTVQDEQAVELRLFRFLRAIAEFPRSRGTLRHLLENARYHPAEMNDVSHPADDSEHFALVRLFSPFWSKSPRGLPPPENASELMRQMFETDQVSSNYRVRWASFSEIPHFKWICWAIIIGSGASLKRAARFFGWRINDRFQYFLERTPMGSELPVRLRYVDDGYLAPLHAIIYAEVSRLGGTLVDFCRVCRRNAYLIDLTDPDVDSRFVQFWHSTVQWIINHRNAIDDEQSGEILDWALHEHIESQANRRAHFSWRGRTPQATLRRVAEYERSRSLPYGIDFHWKPHDWDWQFENEQGTWLFVELLRGSELYAEGDALNHCVSGYSSLCMSGKSAIVSMRLNGQPTITIEIHPPSLGIVQALGNSNRSATSAEREVIQHWFNERLAPQSKDKIGSFEA